jgi:hypothetical protein
MITKTSFLKIMDALKTQMETERGFCQSVMTGFNGHAVYDLSAIFHEEILNALSDELGAAEFISAWVYDHDFGDAGPLEIVDPKAEIKTTAELYDWLICN